MQVYLPSFSFLFLPFFPLFPLFSPFFLFNLIKEEPPMGKKIAVSGGVLTDGASPHIAQDESIPELPPYSHRSQFSNLVTTYCLVPFFATYLQSIPIYRNTFFPQSLLDFSQLHPLFSAQLLLIVTLLTIFTLKFSAYFSISFNFFAYSHIQLLLYSPATFAIS
jgi:hypothetical protein